MKRMLVGVVVVVAVLVGLSRSGWCENCFNSTYMGPNGQIVFCTTCCGQAGCNTYCY